MALENNHVDAEYIISDLDTLRVIADPTRAQIYEILVDRPQAVNQVAEKLGLAASKLYYHFNIMEKHALIRVAETRQIGNLIEKSYVAAAPRLSIDPLLLSFSPGSKNEGVFSLIQSTIDTTREDLLRSLEARAYALEQGAAKKPRNLILTRLLAHLTDEQVAQFQERLHLLLQEFDQAGQGGEDEGDRSQLYGFMVAFYPNFYFQRQAGTAEISGREVE